MDPDLLQPMEITQELIKSALRDKGLVTDDQMTPTTKERQRCNEFSDFLLGMCKTLEYLSNLQRDKFVIPTSPTLMEIALVEEIESMEQRMRHMLPADIRMTKAEDIQLKGIPEVVAKCLLANLRELETIMRKKYNEVKDEEKSSGA